MQHVTTTTALTSKTITKAAAVTATKNVKNSNYNNVSGQQQ